MKYKVESTGTVAMQIPAEIANAEIKVSGNDMYTSSPIFTQSILDMMGIQTEYYLVQGLKQTRCLNASMILMFLKQNDMELNYSGSGKMIIRDEANADSYDSLEIVDTEPGHFYYEYVSGETKQIAGVTAKKMIRHQYDDEGVDHPTVTWYSDEIGPKMNTLFNGIKGMPLECTMDQGEGRAVTYTATEVITGKVKESDFLLPAGYENMSDEDFQAFVEEIMESIQLLQE